MANQATSAVAFEHEPPSPDDPLLAFTPVPHSRPRRNSITPDLQRAFIAHLAATGIVTSAARHIGRSKEALYKLRQRAGAEGFRAAWDAAVDRGVSLLEDCALARAIQGEERPIIRNGEIVGHRRHHNEALTMFFLRNRLPHRYGPPPAGPSRAEVRRQVEQELYDELHERAFSAARQLVASEARKSLEDFTDLLDHMVRNKLEGRAYAHGLDKTKSISENARIMRERAR